MSRNRKLRLPGGILSVVFVVAVTLTGCGRDGDSASESVGITDSTVTLGVTTPLSGALAGPGTCTVAGLEAYAGAVNAAGGVKFGDGKTRTIKIEALDDAYDPQKAKSNYDQLKGKVFALTSGLGTATNRAYRAAAIDDEVPQVLVITGDPIFSDTDESPEQLGFVPTYLNEGEAFGKLLAESGKERKVAILLQNDDYGEGYVEGFKKAVEGAENIEIVEELTYEATDTSVDAQITQLASTGADVVFNAMSINPLTVAALQKAQQLDWKPSWFLPSTSSSPQEILEPGNASAYPGVYSVSFTKVPQSPAFAEDEDVQGFLSDLKENADYADVPAFPQCMWSYIVGATLEQAFKRTTEPTRAAFMEALRDISDFQAPLMLEGTSITTSIDGQPAVSKVVVQKYDGTGYSTVEAID